MVIINQKLLLQPYNDVNQISSHDGSDHDTKKSCLTIHYLH